MKKNMKIPYPGRVPDVGIFHRLRAAKRGLKYVWKPMKRDGVELFALTKFRPIGADDLPLIVTCHNERTLLRPFLAYYRKLGVTRFLCVDDASTDGTVEFLRDQPDVDIYTSNVRFKIAHRGNLWRQMLVERYGANRWYVSVDTDEFLVYRDSETVPLPALISRLESAGVSRILAPMLDMYPPGKVAEAEFSAEHDRMPWEVASLFDTEGYEYELTAKSWKITGGVRRRVFGREVQLSKFPLLYWDTGLTLRKSIHAPAPYWRNFANPLGVLLHFKFFSDFEERFTYAVHDGQHWGQAVRYAEILEAVDDASQLVMEGKPSARYTGPEDLYQRGFFGAVE